MNTAARLIANDTGYYEPNFLSRPETVSRAIGQYLFRAPGQYQIEFSMPRCRTSFKQVVPCVTASNPRVIQMALKRLWCKVRKRLCAFGLFEISDQAASTAFQSSGIVAERPPNLPVLN